MNYWYWFPVITSHQYKYSILLHTFASYEHIVYVCNKCKLYMNLFLTLLDHNDSQYSYIFKTVMYKFSYVGCQIGITEEWYMTNTLENFSIWNFIKVSLTLYLTMYLPNLWSSKFTRYSIFHKPLFKQSHTLFNQV